MLIRELLQEDPHALATMAGACVRYVDIDGEPQRGGGVLELAYAPMEVVPGRPKRTRHGTGRPRWRERLGAALTTLTATVGKRPNNSARLTAASACAASPSGPGDKALSVLAALSSCLDERTSGIKAEGLAGGPASRGLRLTFPQHDDTRITKILQALSGFAGTAYKRGALSEGAHAEAWLCKIIELAKTRNQPTIPEAAVATWDAEFAHARIRIDTVLRRAGNSVREAPAEGGLPLRLPE